MLKNNSYIDRFNRILRKVDAEDTFGVNNDGGLSVTVQTGKIIDTYVINVEFYMGMIYFTTVSCLGVEEQNYKRVKTLLDSINKINGVGKLCFAGDYGKNIAFKISSSFSEFEALDNPFDLIFMGSETIGNYSESIIKSLLGANIFYMNV